MSRCDVVRLPSRHLLVLALSAGLGIAGPAVAQSTGATLRGQVHGQAAVLPGSVVTATHQGTGVSRRAVVAGNGAYVLPGLVPGSYEVVVESAGHRDVRHVTVAVGQTATLNLDLVPDEGDALRGSPQDLATVQVTATALVETKTSEVATYVSNRQIEALPQGTRNFLAFADTVPGMMFEQNPGNGATKLRGGAQSANNINVYIDGVGQKNYVIQGGITGQDSSRGNPFPQMAIGEYKVITSNYKAEYDQISSAAVTAVTKSGTNDFSGAFFWDTTNQGWRARREDERTDGKNRSNETQYGVAFSGPILRDRLHFFTSYEAKDYHSPRDFAPGEGLAVTGLPAWLQEQFVSTNVPFREDLYFGKLSFAADEDNLFELTARRREETGISNVGGQSTSSFGTDTGVHEDRLDLRWQYSAVDWLNDAHLTWEKAYWTMAPVNYGNGYQLTDGTQNTGRLLVRTGAGDGGLQDKGQRGWAIQNDTTYYGFDGHTLKFGVKYKHVDLDTVEQQPYNPQFFYDIAYGGQVPYYVTFGSPVAGTDRGVVRSRNQQFGVYLQDDWAFNERLTVNLGLRWDYEKTPAWSDFMTGADVLAALSSQDPQPGAVIGQTYADTLAAGGVDVSDFISTGSNRQAFRHAWQPRLGFSYDLSDDERHVVFGGIGRAYDRNLFDYLQLERTKATFPHRQLAINSPGHACDTTLVSCVDWTPQLLDRDYLMRLATGGQAGREVWMFANDLKVPYSDQFSLGIRNRLALAGQIWNTSVTYQYIDYNDGLLMLRGNRLANGEYFSATGSPWTGGGVPGMGSLILGTNNLDTTSHAVLVSADKPYMPESPWNLNLAYTYTAANQNVHEQNPAYGWYFPAGGSFGGAYTPRHRLVVSGFGDLGVGFTLSGKLVLSSQLRRWAVDGGSGYEQIRSYEPPGAIGFKQFDLSVVKRFDTGSDLQLKIRADVLNVFDWTNWGGYGINWNNGQTNQWDQYMTRTFKLSFGLDW